MDVDVEEEEDSALQSDGGDEGVGCEILGISVVGNKNNESGEKDGGLHTSVGAKVPSPIHSFSSLGGGFAGLPSLTSLITRAKVGRFPHVFVKLTTVPVFRPLTHSPPTLSPPHHSPSKNKFHHRPLFQNAHTYKYGKSKVEEERGRRIKEEAEALRRMREEELSVLLPWEHDTSMVGRTAEAVSLPPLPRTLMSSLYGKKDKHEEEEEEERYVDMDVNMFTLVKKRSAEFDERVIGVEAGEGVGGMAGGEGETSLLKVQQILRMWRMRQLLKGWMRWYKFSSSGDNSSADGSIVSMKAGGSSQIPQRHLSLTHPLPPLLECCRLGRPRILRDCQTGDFRGRTD
jgi:hypothetical protein